MRNHRSYLWLCILPSLVAAAPVSAQMIFETFTCARQVEDIAFRGNDIWCSTRGGVVRWNRTDMSWRKFTTSDGLLSVDTFSVAVGGDGTVWTTTERYYPYCGVASFDGTRWRNYIIGDEKTVVSSWRIVAGMGSDVWVSTEQGVFFFDGSVWKKDTRVKELLNGQEGTVFQGKNGTVWFSDRHTILIRYDGASWEKIDVGILTKNDYIIGAAEDARGMLWCITHDRVMRFDGVSWNVVDLSSIGITNLIVSIAAAPNGDVWIATWENGIARYNGSSWMVYTKENGLNASLVNSISTDDEGNIWLGTYDGLIRFDGNAFTTFLTTDEIPSNWSKTVAIGNDGKVWIASRGLYISLGGITCYDGHSWRTWSEAGGLLTKSVMALALDGNNFVWVASDKGISSFDGSTWTNYTAADGLPDDKYISIACGPDGAIWAGTESSGVVKRENGQWKTIPDILGGGEVFAIAADGNDTAWFGRANGLDRYDGVAITRYTTADGLPDNRILSLALGKQGELWLGTYYRGACLFDGKSWKTYTTSDGLVDNNVMAITVDDAGTVWFGTLKGLTRYTGSKWTTYIQYYGLVSDVVYSIAVERDGTVWAATAWGLSRCANLQTGVSETSLPGEFGGVNSYPNPFNGSTMIIYKSKGGSELRIAVYSMTGQKIRTLVSGSAAPGVHSVLWDGRDETGHDVSSGVYLVGMHSGGVFSSRKITLLR